MTTKNAVNIFLGMRTQLDESHTSLAMKVHPWSMSSVHACAVCHKRMLKLRYHDARIHLPSKSLEHIELILKQSLRGPSIAQSVQWLRYGLENSGFKSRQDQGILSSPKRPDRLWGPTQHPVQWEQEVLSPEVNRPVREAMDSSSRSIDVRKEWKYTSNLAIYLHGLCKENVTFTQALRQILRWMKK